MATLTLPQTPRAVRKSERGTGTPAGGLYAGLQTVAVGLGTVQLLLDIGQAAQARATLKAVRARLRRLRRRAA